MTDHRICAPASRRVKKGKGLKIFLFLLGGVAVLVALAMAVAAAVIGGAAKSDRFKIGGDLVPSVKLALGEERTVTGVRVNSSNGVTAKIYTYRVDGNRQNVDMRDYLRYLEREDGFRLLEDWDFAEPSGEVRMARASKRDDGYGITVQVDYGAQGYTVTLTRERGGFAQGTGPAPTEPASQGEPTATAALPNGDEYVLELAREALSLLKNKDWGALGRLVHPKQGLTFSPYGYVDPGALRLDAGDVVALGAEDYERVWGEYASGEPIEFTAEQYYDIFIFDRDYTVAPQVAVNSIIRSEFENNLFVFGNGCVYAEFHFPGSGPDPEYNWSSLRLVFGYYEGDDSRESDLYLVGIVHDMFVD